METTLVNGSTLGASTSATKTPKKEMDKDSFMMLLVAQLQHQDPTQPQDAGEMMQQMVGFSSLEQMQNMNSSLQGIQLQNQGLFQAQSSSLVGKRVRVSSSGFDLQSGKATMGVELASDALVTITIKDAAGKVVATLDKGSLKAGNQNLTWDGRTAEGVQLADGAYSMEITAKDTAGKTVEAKASTFVTVDSVIFANGTVLIQAGNRRFSLADVNEIAA